MMITGEMLGVILAGIGGLIGGGGITALIHEFSVRRKVKADADVDKEKLLQMKDQTNTELMKYFADKIKQLNDETAERFDHMQTENDDLRKQVADLNRKLTMLNRWIMVDNAAYRSWLESELRKRDPDIDIPVCPPPPDVFRDDDIVTDSSNTGDNE